MRTLRSFSSNICAIFLTVTLLVSIFPPPVLAASILGPSVTLSDSHNDATGVDYTISFGTGSSATLEQINFQFATTNGGTTRPQGLNLLSATLTTHTGLNSSWSLDTSSATSGLVTLNNSSGESIAANTTLTITLSGITNPELADCNAATTNLSDTCYVGISTYSDAGITGVDNGNTFFTIIEDPSMSFEVDNVPAGETHDGITATLDSTSDSIAFGHIAPGTVQYAIQKLTIKSNAPHGYEVDIYIHDPFEGVEDNNNEISPFGAVNATWTTPQSWDTPFGTSSNHNSGWIGAGTSDGRVTGWNGVTAKFGPLSATPEPVAYSSGPDTTGTTVYVIFGIEINGYQPADYYTGSIAYKVDARY